MRFTFINRLALIPLLCVVAALEAQTTIHHTLVAQPGTWSVAPGVTATGWFYNGQLPGPLLRGTVGDTLRVQFINRTPEPTSVHFHGLPVPLGQDGVPMISRPAVEPGQEYTYTLPLTRPGTYFYHSHFGHQLDRGLHGLLIVDPATSSDAAYDRELIVDLDDLLPGDPIHGQDPIYADYLMNGKNSAGQTPWVVDQGDVLRIRFINSSSFTTYVVTLDGHLLEVSHADGRKVQPVSVAGIPIGPGERYDAYVDADHPGTWSLAAANILNPGVTLVRGIVSYNGSPYVAPSASYAPPGNYSPNRLSYDLLASAEPSPPLPIAPQRFYSLDMGFNPISYTFFLGGQAFPNANTVDVTHGEDVRITMQNFTGQYHPMHLHGHFFRLHTAAGGTQNPPLRDTVLVPPASMAGIPQVSFDFVADSPGQWVFHCHTIYHAESGMNRVVTYVGGDQDQDGLDDSIDYEPLDAHPVLTADDMGFGFVPGGAVSLDCQWRQGTPTWFYYGLDLGQPLSLGAIGDLQIFSSYLLALTHAGIHDVASLVLPIPNVPNLTGFRAVFQALVYDAALNPSFRLSTPTVVRVN